MTYRDQLYARLQAKCKDMKRKLSAAEVFEEAVACHEAHSQPVKAQKRDTPITAGAEQVYQLYPLKVGREAALRAISVQLKKHELSYLLDKTNQFREAVSSWPSSYRYFPDGGDRCPHPSTFYSQGRFGDDPSTWRRAGAKTPARHQYIAPIEPENWRQAFPDFVEKDKPWNQLQAAQHAYIIATLSAVETSTKLIHEDSE